MTDKEKLRLIGRVVADASPDIGLSVRPCGDRICLEGGSNLKFEFSLVNRLFEKYV